MDAVQASEILSPCPCHTLLVSVVDGIASTAKSPIFKVLQVAMLLTLVLHRTVEQIDDAVLDGDAEQRLLTACAKSRSRLLWPAVVLAVNTGLRRSELFSLRWKQIDFVQRVIRVGESKTRAGRHREVPVNSRAWPALQAWAEQFPDRADDHFVFPSEHVGAGGDNFDANITGTAPEKAVGTLKTAWHTAKKAAGVKVRWHDLRHTAVTRLLENSQTLPMVASIMGWSPSTTVRMAQRYGHISTDARRAAMEAMNAPRPKLSDAAFENDVATEKEGVLH